MGIHVSIARDRSIYIYICWGTLNDLFGRCGGADLIFLISKTVFDFTGTFQFVAGSTSMLVGIFHESVMGIDTALRRVFYGKTEVVNPWKANHHLNN